MELLIPDCKGGGGCCQECRHFHDASQHGIGWAVLNELLHVIMFIYTLYGIIQFRVKFIKMVKLVHWASRFIIAHSWYLSIKFALISTLLYVFNVRLEGKSISMMALNCSLSNYDVLVAAELNRSVHTTTDGAAALPATSTSHQGSSSPLPFDAYLPNLADLLDTFGGPFRLLDNRATLMYGVYSIAIYIMLAIFPLELMYFITVGFNFIRFVLSDPKCMMDLYARREKHLSRLASWSRNQSDSLLTRGAKMILNQRDLRSNYANHLHGRPARHGVGPPPPPLMAKAALMISSGPRSSLSSGQVSHLELFPELPIEEDDEDDEVSDGWIEETGLDDEDMQQRQRIRRWQSPSLNTILRKEFNSNYSAATVAQMAQLQFGHLHNVKQLKTRLAINHLDRPSYQVAVANRNSTLR